MAQTVGTKHHDAKQSITLASEDSVRRATERGYITWSSPLTSLIKSTKCACTNGMSERVKSRHAGLATGCRHKTSLRYCSGWMNSFTWLSPKRQIPSTSKTPLHMVAGHSLSRLATLIHSKFRNEGIFVYILIFTWVWMWPVFLILFRPSESFNKLWFPLVWNDTLTIHVILYCCSVSRKPYELTDTVVKQLYWYIT